MITRLKVRCENCDYEQDYLIPGELVEGVGIYHSDCGQKMDYWTERVEKEEATD